MPQHPDPPHRRAVSSRRTLVHLAVCVGALLGCAGSPSRTAGAVAPEPSAVSRPLIIAHRGASGYLPEHTIEAYTLAVEQGADFIEPDLVVTRDGVLIARHENEIGETTDAAARFPERRTTRIVDGRTVAGWFAEDFTLAEVRTLRARERLPFRSQASNGQFRVPTFDEVLALARRLERETGRTIGVYPETKHPSYFAAIGLPLEPPMLADLTRHGYTSASDAVFIQSFEVGNLRALRSQTPVRLIQLIAAGERPPDLAAAGDPRSLAELLTPAGLREIATYADGLGVQKEVVIPRASDGSLEAPTSLVADAHAAGLLVHVWTFRSDARFLPPAYGGDPAAEVRAFAALGIDGLFTDFPDHAVAALGESAPSARPAPPRDR